MLDRRRRQVEGEFESIRVAPGRIDTVIVHPDDRRTNIQIRPDMKIAFDSTHDFPTPADFRDDGLRAGMLSEVDTSGAAAVDRRHPPRQRRAATSTTSWSAATSSTVASTSPPTCASVRRDRAPS